MEILRLFPPHGTVAICTKCLPVVSLLWQKTSGSTNAKRNSGSLDMNFLDSDKTQDLFGSAQIMWWEENSGGTVMIDNSLWGLPVDWAVMSVYMVYFVEIVYHCSLRWYCLTFVALLSIFSHPIEGYPPNYSSLYFNYLPYSFHITRNFTFIIVYFKEISSWSTSSVFLSIKCLSLSKKA